MLLNNFHLRTQGSRFFQQHFLLQCSKTCSKGVKSRQVKCYASHDSSQPIADSNCVANQKPGEQEMCMAKPCDTSLSKSALNNFGGLPCHSVM